MKKKIYALLVLLMAILVIPVNAKSLDAFQAGETVKLEKELDSTTFVAGQAVDVESTIKGIIFTAGQELSLSGSNDYAFVAGQYIDIENMKTKDAFIAGQEITIKESSIRDLFVAGETINIESDISKNVYVAGGKVKISGKIKGDVNVSAETIILEKDAEITGTLNYPKEAKLTDHGAKVEKKTTYRSTSTEVEKETLMVTRIMGQITAYLSMIVIACIALYFGKSFFQKMEKYEKNTETFVKMSTTGLGVLIGVPVFGLIGLILQITGLVVIFPLTILALIAYGVGIYLSAIPTAYYVGKWLLKDKMKNDYALMITTLGILYIVRLIPMVGGFITFLTLCFGLGVFTKMILPKKKAK